MQQLETSNFVHGSATTRSTVVGVSLIHKLTVDEFVDFTIPRRLGVAKFSVQNVEITHVTTPS